MKKFTGRVLALDLATVTGYAWGKPETIPKFGVQRFAKPGDKRPVAYRKFRLWLDLFCSEHKPDWIVYESPALPMVMAGKTNIDTLKLLMGLAEHLEEWAHQKFELREASVSQIRSHFLGQNYKSMIAKQMTIDRCREMGWAVDNSDEADACALWHYQICCLRPDIGVSSTPLFRNRT